MERTSDLNKIKNGSQYTWGEVIKIHDFGIYSVIEYFEWNREGVSVKTGYSSSEVAFTSYVDGKAINYEFHSFDEAVIAAVAYKLTGNVVVVDFIMKMLS